MDIKTIEKSIRETLEDFEIIDCHEHLGPEPRRTNTPVDVFTLFAHYTQGDVRVAGMTEKEYQSLFNQDIPLDRRWDTFEPYWKQIRWGSYSRAALIAARHFYGVEDINRDTYAALSDAIKNANTPGIYERVLRDACKIRTSLTQCMTTQTGTPLLTPLMPIAGSLESWDDLVRFGDGHSIQIRSLDDILDASKKYVLQVKDEGAVGLKMLSNPYKNPSRMEALAAFDKLKSGTEQRLPQPNPLRDYVVDYTIAFATQQDLVIAVHTGYWGDFRTLDPLHMIPILQRHPNARFDIYHLGYPWVREALMLGKGFGNVWLNLCWTHIISQRFVVAALEEAIDLIPMNKILGFGGDYGIPVEKVYGHLVMAREDIAEVLAKRIASGQMTESRAIEIAHQWLYENPKELYRLKV